MGPLRRVFPSSVSTATFSSDRPRKLLQTLDVWASRGWRFLGREPFKLVWVHQSDSSYPPYYYHGTTDYCTT